MHEPDAHGIEIVIGHCAPLRDLVLFVRATIRPDARGTRLARGERRSVGSSGDSDSWKSSESFEQELHGHPRDVPAETAPRAALESARLFAVRLNLLGRHRASDFAVARH